MGWPFIRPKEQWVPRKSRGVDPSISPVEREMLDALDSLEQQAQFAVETAVRAHNIVVVVAAIVLLINGPAVLKIVTDFLQKGP
jgi:hypothetical protein